MKREGLFFAAILLVCVSAWSAERPPQHPELRRAINLGKYDQAREYIKQGAEEIYCGNMPADSAKAVWGKRWKKEPYHALRGCLRQYTSFYPEKACQSKWSSPEICAGRLKDSASLADPKRFYALASAALDDSEYKTLLKDEIALLGEGRLMALADDAGFDFARDSVLPENVVVWTEMLRDLQRKFKLFGNGEKGFYPGSEEWTASPQLQASVEAHKAAKVAKAKADSAHAAIWKRAAHRGESRSLPEERTVHIIKIVEVVDYTPTGRRIVVYSDGAPTTPQFTGKEMDAETGLYHFGARQYDPELALWAQVDPGRQFASPYVYAGNGMNPIVARDDDGGKIWPASRQDEHEYNKMRNQIHPNFWPRLYTLEQSDIIFRVHFVEDHEFLRDKIDGSLSNGQFVPVEKSRKIEFDIYVWKGGKSRDASKRKFESFGHELLGHGNQAHRFFQEHPGAKIEDWVKYAEDNVDALEQEVENESQSRR